MRSQGCGVRGDMRGAVGSWLISLVVGAFVFWVVLELLGVRSVPSGEFVTSTDAIELHRLLPEVTGSLGRVVRLDGAVVGGVLDDGFWVRDLRDNIIFVGVDPADRVAVLDGLRAGTAVRVHGVLELFSPVERAERLAGAGLVLPASVVVVREIKVLPTREGIEILVD